MTFIKESFVQNSCAIPLHLIFWIVITAYVNQPVLELWRSGKTFLLSQSQTRNIFSLIYVLAVNIQKNKRGNSNDIIRIQKWVYLKVKTNI